MSPAPWAPPAATALFEHMADAVYLLDPDSSNIVWGNRAAWASLGLTPEAVLNHSVLSLQMDVTGAPQWSDIAAVIRQSDCFTFVGRHRHALGHEVAVEVNTTHFSDKGREYFLSVARDISRRMALEVDLKQRENQLWFALNEAMDGLWDWDVRSGEVFFSPQLKRMLGYGPHEMTPALDTWLLNIHPEDAERVRAALNEHLQGRRSRYEAEYRLQNRNGNYLWMHDQGQVCDRDPTGAATRMVGMVKDITVRKHHEAELAQHRHRLQALVDERTQALSVAKEAAESASRAKSSFLTHMSHELRTPLAAIMGMTQLARQRAQDPVLREQLAKAEGASQHLLGLINDILDISRIEAERMPLEANDFALGEVLDSLWQMAGHRATERGLLLTIDLPEALGQRTLNGDPLRLKQILLNLVDNALKFTPQGRVQVRTLALEEGADELLLQFEVEDSGIGIAPELQGQLFTAFEQGNQSMTRKYGGTGLGLAISKRLAGMMGGDIGLRSTPGQGSTFWFTVRLRPGALPAAPPALPAQGQARASLRQRHAGAAVLLAEDEPVNREVGEFLLKDAGLQVHTAEDGQLALALARQHRYALILMDMQMPRLNGLDATRAIRAEALNGRTPILAMTANAFEEDRQHCLQAGMDSHLAKPIKPEVFYQTLLDWLDRERAA